jgi:hypothetical protein
MLTSALSCLHCWTGESCLLSGELERCTDLQVVPSALEIAFHLPAAAPWRFQTMNQGNKRWWFEAFVHLCGRERKPATSGSMKDCVRKLRWRDWRFVRPVCVQELA